MLNDLVARARAFRTLAAPILEDAYGIPQTHHLHVDDVCAGALAAEPGACLSAVSADDARAILARLHAADHDLFLPDRGWRFAALTIAASVGSSDHRSWQASMHRATMDERRRAVRAARARLRAEGRQIPKAPAVTPDGGRYVSDDRLA